MPVETDPEARTGPAAPEVEGRAGADVFLSYSRRDAAFAPQVHAFLTERGKDVWIDAEDIPASSPWREDIAAAIDAADNVVFVVSPDSIVAEAVRAGLRGTTDRIARRAESASRAPGRCATSEPGPGVTSFV